MKKALLLMLVLAAVMAVGSTAAAGPITINYAVGGWGPHVYANDGQPGDTIELLAFAADPLFLAENTPTFGKINGLVFSVNYTNPQGQTNVEFAREMTVSTVAGQITQFGVFDSWLTYYPNDALWLFEGATTTFNLPGGYVTVMPLALAIENAGDPLYQRDVMATFEWHPDVVGAASVPDGGWALSLLGGALVGLGALRRKMRG